MDEEFVQEVRNLLATPKYDWVHGNWICNVQVLEKVLSQIRRFPLENCKHPRAFLSNWTENMYCCPDCGNRLMVKKKAKPFIGGEQGA